MKNSIRIWDVDICKDINILKKSTIVLYGAAENGRMIAELLNAIDIKPQCFCDTYSGKWKTKFCGLDVISPYYLKKNFSNSDVMVILCASKGGEILKLMDEFEMSGVKAVSMWGIKNAIMCNMDILTIESKYLQLKATILKYNNLLFKQIAINYLRDFITSNEGDIWVLQPGKTASSSLKARLDSCGVRSISEHLLEYPKFILGDLLTDIWNDTIIQKKKEKIKIITAVREPISRNYSAFWQAFTENLERAYDMPILNKDIQIMYHSFEKLIISGSAETEEKISVSTPYTWRDEFVWFNEQINKYLGVDIYRYPFDKNKGCSIIRQDNIEIFVFKVEKINDIITDICSFVGVPELPEVNTNIAEEKNYGLAYRQFRNEVKLSKEYVDYYYKNNKYMDYFYSEKEKKSFLEKWRDNID